MPGPDISALSAVGLAPKVEGGKIAIMQDKIICKEGKEIITKKVVTTGVPAKILLKAYNNATLVNQTIVNYIIDNQGPQINLIGNTNLNGIVNFTVSCDDENGISRIA